MSKPIRKVTITDALGGQRTVTALFDTGAFPSIVRESSLPEETPVIVFSKPRIFGTATGVAALEAMGTTHLEIQIGDRMIEDEAYVARNLTSELIIGAKTMQAWDISVQNRNGQTDVIVGRDLRDPEIQTIEAVVGTHAGRRGSSVPIG